MLLKVERILDRFSDVIGWISAVLMLVMLVNVFYDAILRYFFRTGSIAMQELEWHIFSIVFLFGISYALKEEGHVRVDVLYDGFSPKVKAIVNIAGTVFFLIPLAYLIISGSIWFVHESYSMGEISGDPGGLTHTYLIKAVIPLSFIFLIISALGFVVRNIRIYRGLEPFPQQKIEDNIL
ncbi:TRAP-type mannitol/chloroaromatic compound transport system, small permease component [Desulfuromusa kysingii]|uniref:TRAP-type mannitol/chloroaromatic compound transport system, small permease component n=1 Tax=Desulfuromusa kysingii TaxID=37625 RepID=A0A1H4CIR2_9BACT|nr:TRAP transporter small permease subunit [Desulfuromusa kysingii]SEA60311.1 TRAP-type mannitol/chloroaromatic compound transport system, small permease component [Desulfuromusa kysingii]